MSDPCRNSTKMFLLVVSSLPVLSIKCTSSCYFAHWIGTNPPLKKNLLYPVHISDWGWFVSCLACADQMLSSYCCSDVTSF